MYIIILTLTAKLNSLTDAIVYRVMYSISRSTYIYLLIDVAGNARA